MIFAQIERHFDQKIVKRLHRSQRLPSRPARPGPHPGASYLPPARPHEHHRAARRRLRNQRATSWLGGCFPTATRINGGKEIRRAQRHAARARGGRTFSFYLIALRPRREDTIFLHQTKGDEIDSATTPSADGALSRPPIAAQQLVERVHGRNPRRHG